MENILDNSKKRIDELLTQKSKYGFALVGCLVGYGLALLRAYKSLDGMNGDISGYALTIGELCAVAVYALI